MHAPLDGDVVFAAATGEKPVDPLVGLTELGMVAANVVARAIARGVYAATRAALPGALPAGRIGSASNDVPTIGGLSATPDQALTESDALACAEIACASRWIICSTKL